MARMLQLFSVIKHRWPIDIADAGWVVFRSLFLSVSNFGGSVGSDRTPIIEATTLAEPKRRAALGTYNIYKNIIGR
jgi:hypothetical protein